MCFSSPLSPPTAEQHNIIIHCAASCKIPSPKKRWEFFGLVYLGRWLSFPLMWGGKKEGKKMLRDIPRVFTQVERAWDNKSLWISKRRVAILYMPACIKSRPSSHNYRQIHQAVINGSSCSWADCKMVISWRRTCRGQVTRQIFVAGTSFLDRVPCSHYLRSHQKMNCCGVQSIVRHW